MKILYAIQGTGNGHLSRAKDIIPILQKKADLDLLISGTQAEVKLSYSVKYRYKGMSFYFGKKGGINFYKTIFKNNIFRILNEIFACKVTDYDLVINDFEPITAWACRFKKVPIISLSHQGILYAKNVPKPTYNDFLGKFIIKNYAKCDVNYGFHFKKYAKNIFTPIIRKEIRNLQPTNQKHYTVYLPAYSDKIITKVLSQLSEVQWQVFSKHTQKDYKVNNITFYRVNSSKFEKSLTSCAGILCGAGFETPAEALFLNKKLMVIPMKNQYEQHFNAEGLREMGVPVLSSFSVKNSFKIKEWIHSNHTISVSYPDETQQIIDFVLSDFI